MPLYPSPVTPVSSPALATHYVISDVTCVVKRATVTNTSAGTLYLHLFDADDLPDPGTAPVVTPITVSAGTANGNDWRPEGVRFPHGCVAALSSTLDTLTIVGSAVGRFFAELER